MAYIPPPSGSHNATPAWAAEAIPPVGYLSRKALPIKKQDAEPLSRQDVQFDLLQYLFTNKQAVFTNPISPKSHRKLTFSELYVSALINSQKCSKVLKDKMVDTPEFSIEFAKISLLTNVGRINTTMAFFPEMKTALRTYHPVPSLQKTDGNAQDAPRIKNCLKAAVLPSELKTIPPSTPEEVLAKLRAGQQPSTSVVNLIFVLANHAAPLSSIHFDGNLNFLDLFLPTTRLASADRGRAFLWLLYHYLENEHPPNPFDDEHSARHPNKIPFLRKLTFSEQQRENVDTPEEIHWGNVMSSQRNHFLQKLVTSADGDKKSRTGAPHFVTETGNNLPRSQRQLHETPKDERSFLFYVPSQEPQPSQTRQPRHSRPHAHRPGSSEDRENNRMLQNAWRLALETDPLADSDDEVMGQYTRLDYARRLSVITRICKRPPSPA